jgi:hypothetical protein
MSASAISTPGCFETIERALGVDGVVEQRVPRLIPPPAQAASAYRAAVNEAVTRGKVAGDDGVLTRFSTPRRKPNSRAEPSARRRFDASCFERCWTGSVRGALERARPAIRRREALFGASERHWGADRLRRRAGLVRDDHGDGEPVAALFEKKEPGLVKSE